MMFPLRFSIVGIILTQNFLMYLQLNSIIVLSRLRSSTLFISVERIMMFAETMYSNIGILIFSIFSSSESSSSLSEIRRGLKYSEIIPMYSSIDFYLSSRNWAFSFSELCNSGKAMTKRISLEFLLACKMSKITFL